MNNEEYAEYLYKNNKVREFFLCLKKLYDANNIKNLTEHLSKKLDVTNFKFTDVSIKRLNNDYTCIFHIQYNEVKFNVFIDRRRGNTTLYNSVKLTMTHPIFSTFEMDVRNGGFYTRRRLKNIPDPILPDYAKLEKAFLDNEICSIFIQHNITPVTIMKIVNYLQDFSEYHAPVDYVMNGLTLWDLKHLGESLD